jgi:hypothetical protein
MEIDANPCGGCGTSDWPVRFAVWLGIPILQAAASHGAT